MGDSGVGKNSDVW